MPLKHQSWGTRRNSAVAKAGPMVKDVKAHLQHRD
jgi:hypothetical protein